MRRLPTALALLTLTSTLLPQTASAFCRTTTCRTTTSRECARDERGCVIDGNPLKWPSRCVSFSFQRSGTATLVPDDTKAATLAAFAEWSERPCADGRPASITFSATEDVECREPRANRDQGNANVVFFRDDTWPYRGIDGTLATTTVSYFADGTIWDADIAVNAAFNVLTLEEDKPEYDLPSILNHEVGHFLGIAHSDETDALMAPSYAPGTTRRALSDDDRDALCAIYPADRQASCDPAPHGGFASRCDGTLADDDANDGGAGGCAQAPAAGAPLPLAAGALWAMLAAISRRARRSAQR